MYFTIVVRAFLFLFNAYQHVVSCCESYFSMHVGKLSPVTGHKKAKMTAFQQDTDDIEFDTHFSIALFHNLILFLFSL